MATTATTAAPPTSAASSYLWGGLRVRERQGDGGMEGYCRWRTMLGSHGMNQRTLLGWLRTILPFLQLVSLLNESSRSPDTFVAIFEGKDNYDGVINKGLDTRWAV